MKSYPALSLLLALSLGCNSPSPAAHEAPSIAITSNKPSAAPEATPQSPEPPLLDDVALAEPMKAVAAPSAKKSKGSTGKESGLYAMKGPKGEAPAKEEEEKPVETWKKAQARANVSRLMIGDTESLHLEEMHVSVKVDGFRARVLLDMYYPNNTGRQVEGNFSLRLPEEATPFFLAFGETSYQAQTAGPNFSKEEARVMSFSPEGILHLREKSWNTPKVARMVPKEEAAYAYRETVRGRVDPALAEWAGSGVFTARLFPLVSGKTHRVVVGYDVDLTRAGSDLELRVELPEGVEDMTVDLSVATLKGVELTVSGASKLEDVAGRKFARIEKPSKEVVLRQAKAGAQMLTGEDKETGNYFASKIVPSLKSEAKQASSQAIFLVDASLSSNPDQFNIWLKLMEAILKENRSQLAKFQVMFFNIESFGYSPGFTVNNETNVASLMKFADNVVLEGATDLGAVLSKAAKLEGDIFLLSDGASTWGEGEAFALSAALAGRKGSLFAYSTGIGGADINMLQHLTREAGGALFTVVGEAEVNKVATAHQKRPWELLDITVTGGSDLLLAGRPRALFPGQQLLLVGKGAPAAGAKAVLKLKQGTVEESVEVELGEKVSSDLAPRVYGQVATTQLEDLGYALEKDAGAFARHFRVTGKTTSLLMLESESDYLRFGIVQRDDEEQIKKLLVSEKVDEFFKTIQEMLADPKKSFFAWEKRLEKIPGGAVKLEEDLQKTIEALPATSFAVGVPALTCVGHTKTGIPATVLEMLEKHKLEYDAINVESKRRGGSCDKLKALSSLIEENPGDTVLARDVAFQAIEMKLPGQAYGLFRRLLVQRPYEPQTYHAMAQTLASLGKADLALIYFELGLAGKWDARFGEFKTIISLDYLHFLATSSGKLSAGLAEFVKTRRGEVETDLGLVKADAVVTITWNTDGTDMDLHVTEPSGEKCYYGFTETALGGTLTQDVTQGYGPEMYVMEEATQGKYLVEVHSYASDRNRMSARTKILATVYEKFGSAGAKLTRKVIVLDDKDTSNSSEDNLKEILTLQLTGKPMKALPVDETKLLDQADSLREAIYNVLDANEVEITDEVETKLSETNTDVAFLRKWLKRFLTIDKKSAKVEFAAFMGEASKDTQALEVELMKDALYMIFAANQLETDEKIDDKIEKTTDYATLKRWMTQATMSKSAYLLILGTTGPKAEPGEEAPTIEPGDIREAIYSILQVKGIEVNDDAQGQLNELVSDKKTAVLQKMMQKATSITTADAANQMILQ